jgi:hypothetical protein
MVVGVPVPTETEAPSGLLSAPGQPPDARLEPARDHSGELN